MKERVSCRIEEKRDREEEKGREEKRREEGERMCVWK
jgi:hypothetical protein